MFNFFNSAKRNNNNSELMFTFANDLLSVSGLILSKFHQEQFNYFASLSSKEDWTFEKCQEAKNLANEILEYHKKYSRIIGNSHSKEFWVKFFCEKNGAALKYAADDGVKPFWIAVDGIPFNVEIGKNGDEYSLIFTCLDPWDEGTILNIREEVEALHLPFKLICC